MIRTSTSYAIACAPLCRIRTELGRSTNGFGLFCGHHRHPGDPTWNRFVEFLLHGEVAAGREGSEGGDPGEDLIGAATRRLTHLVGVERIGTPDLAAAQDLHELFVPLRIERLAGALAGFGDHTCLEHAFLA